MSFENANPNAAQQQMEGISDLPAADGLAMLAAATPAPKQRKKEVKSQRAKDIAHFKPFSASRARDAKTQSLAASIFLLMPCRYSLVIHAFAS